MTAFEKFKKYAKIVSRNVSAYLNENEREIDRNVKEGTRIIVNELKSDNV